MVREVGAFEAKAHRAATLREAPGAACYVSIATIWEAAIKVGIGKLKLPYDLETDLPGILDENGFTVIGIELAEAAAVKDLEGVHRDPFDRVQIVQASRRGWTVISRDSVFESYGLRRIW